MLKKQKKNSSAHRKGLDKSDQTKLDSPSDL